MGERQGRTFKLGLEEEVLLGPVPGHPGGRGAGGPAVGAVGAAAPAGRHLPLRNVAPVNQLGALSGKECAEKGPRKSKRLKGKLGNLQEWRSMNSPDTRLVMKITL